MLFQKDDEENFKEYEEFINKDNRVLMVRIFLDSSKTQVLMSDINRFLRCNGYKGITTISDKCDTHILLINMITNEMASVLNHFDYFEKRCMRKTIIDFEMFLQFHIHLKGKMFIKITIGDRTVFFDIPNN